VLEVPAVTVTRRHEDKPDPPMNAAREQETWPGQWRRGDAEQNCRQICRQTVRRASAEILFYLVVLRETLSNPNAPLATLFCTDKDILINHPQSSIAAGQTAETELPPKPQAQLR
jgi:hypothetical protein